MPNGHQTFPYFIDYHPKMLKKHVLYVLKWIQKYFWKKNQDIFWPLADAGYYYDNWKVVEFLCDCDFEKLMNCKYSYSLFTAVTSQQISGNVYLFKQFAHTCTSILAWQLNHVKFTWSIHTSARGYKMIVADSLLLAD